VTLGILRPAMHRPALLARPILELKPLRIRRLFDPGL
jgi:hypothetical protein